MKFSKKLILAFFASSIISLNWVFAAWIDHFEVNFSVDSAKVWEALDLTIEAVDKNNETILDYEWTILIFSESDPEAELPSALEENTYTYTPADQWMIKFENWVKFKSQGTQNIHIYDLNDDTVFWVAEVVIEEEAVIENLDISIISPENGLTIWENSIWISWMTQKNHQVKIIVNWKEEITTTSNNDWVFEKVIENLEDWDNLFKAQVLDADLNVIWESQEISIKVESDNLNIKAVEVSPESVDPENSFEVKVISNPWLTDVNIILNDVITKLEETDAGSYIAKVYAPKEAGTYKIDVQLKDELGHEKTELGAWSIIVNEVELNAAEEVTTNTWTTQEVVETKEEIKVDDKKELKITGLKLVELKTRSILTWDNVEWAESYNVYKKIENWDLELIENVETPKFEVEITWDEIKYDYFAVKAVSKTASWEVYEWNLSDATKVKTWPEMIILLLISLLIGWLLFVSKQKRA